LNKRPGLSQTASSRFGRLFPNSIALSKSTLTRGKQPPTIRRFRAGFRWNRVKLQPYKAASRQSGEFCGASRQVLIGEMREKVAFHLRYFELEAGGFTSLERHKHAHVVIAMTGRGVARVGTHRYKIEPFDTLYIGPEELHQLSACRGERFGFFCIVNARRDKPRPPR
jgi:ribulose-bisphosphate carboxylase large chain